MGKKELAKLVKILVGRLDHRPEKEHRDKSKYTRKIKHKDKNQE